MIAESKQRQKVNNDVINNKKSSGAMYSFKIPAGKLAEAGIPYHKYPLSRLTKLSAVNTSVAYSRLHSPIVK